MISSLIEPLGEAEIGEKHNKTFSQVEPDPLKCKFCGKELKFERTGEGPLKFWIIPKKCDCDKAKEYWNKYDEAMIYIKKEIELFKEEEKNKAEVERLLKKSKLGMRFMDRTFETFNKTKNNEAAFKKTYDYATNFKDYEKNGKGLLLTGQVGTGKTHLTAAIANYLMFESYIPVKFGNVTSLLSEIKNTYSNDEVTESDLIHILSSVRLLIIDDLGKEKSTEWSNSIVYTIINNRYENYKPIIATTNLSIKELENKIGDASVSRLIEMCDGIKMDGFDFRKTKLA